MGKLLILSGSEVGKILVKFGFLMIRQKGSHMIFQKKENDSTITVPVPNHSEIKIGTLMSIIRQSGIPKSEFES